MSSVSVVIPVYRSGNSIPLLVKELAVEMPKIADRFEVILVEDDGGDGSWQIKRRAIHLHNLLSPIQSKQSENFAELDGRIMRLGASSCCYRQFGNLPQSVRHVNAMIIGRC